MTYQQQAASITQYQRLQPFKAISFDLDDTLYNNLPYVVHASEQLFELINRSYPATMAWNSTQWQQLKHHLFTLRPELAHDTSVARYAMLHQGLLHFGYSEIDASQGAQLGMDCFHYHRSDFTVASEVLTVLQKLGQYYPLIGITNGNVDSKRIGLSDVMQFVLHPGHGIKMKPHSDMFTLACKQLAITPAQLLHIGDHPSSDIAGAKMAGCQSVWLNPCMQQRHKKAQTVLPHIEINQLDLLLELL
ncbi:HAD-IA family hydrolase [Shewanella ulleungensis]|uniref:Haloacid dehalogenase n=1 Tax=Shewanella ulleungensis TaxID=2282699 RepID=A0ABQ2QSX4_9GAMM|nr:HAD-IA family hydrolase [Shewanella ulleungensis]MCL1150654.1 HAD-IA family hydrolase [Shewanella ulleungensis]GGP92857.1 haloacid dehalogenase [Shewanella ulleungensis]